MINVRKRYILRATVGYAVFSALWIILSDQLFTSFTDISVITWLSTLKGLTFVLVTATLLYFALHKVPAGDGTTFSNTGLVASSPETVLEISETASLMPRWFFYLFSVAVTGAMLLLRAGIEVPFGDRLMLIMFMFPIILSALLGGLGPGLVSTAVTACCTAYFFILPLHNFLMAAPYDHFQWGMLIANGIIVSTLSEAMHRSLRRSQAISRHLNAVVTGTSDAVFVKDLKGRYQLFNESAARFANRPASEVIGHDDTFIFAADVAASLMALDRSIMESGRTQTHEENLKTIDGKEMTFLVTKGPVFDNQGKLTGLFGISRDITERKQADHEKEETVELLRLCNESGSIRDLMQNLVLYFQKLTGCSAVGVRMRQGEDFPYYETRGFPDDFVLAENSLCSFDGKGELVRDDTGHPVLDCMCGNILCGRFDPAKSFFSPRGSFWSNCTTALLASTTEADRQARTRNRCNGEGYESVALVPIRAHGETFGLFQFNDKRKGCFTEEEITRLEDHINYVAISLAKLMADEALEQSEATYRSLFDNMLNGFAYCRMLFENNEPVDFIYLRVNQAFETLTGLKGVVGKRVTEAIPGIREADPKLFEIYGRVALTGQPERFEIFVDALQMWFWISVYSPQREYFVAVFDVITERKKAEDEKAIYQRQLELLLETAGEGIFGVNREGTITFVNQAAIRLIGLAKDNLIGLNSHAVFHSHRSDSTNHPWHDCPLSKTLDDAISRSGEETYFKADGSGFPIEFICTAIVERGVTSGAVMIFRDITERRRIESELRQAQKLEGIGQLAGGIAHDFNNVLSAVVGFAGLLQMQLDKADPLAHYADEIMAAGQRGAALTQQILAVSRKQVLDMRPVNLNEIVRSLEKMLHRLVREDIDIQYNLSGEDLMIFADASQIDQVLINLVINARDAMPGGGRLNIATEAFIMDSQYIGMHGYGSPGEYAVMTISDTGCGMDAGTRSHIFEPFFTTKESGKGTGLGLAVVHGIAKQHNGHITVYSEMGKGTTFKLYLPLTEHGIEETERKTVVQVKGGTETILIAEDDASLRKLSRALLSHYGYKVIEASDGDDAVRKFAGNRDVIQLAILDAIMPKKNGKEAYDEMRKLCPDMKTIIMSGYSEDIFNHTDISDKGIVFIQKPVTPINLLRKVRETLDG
ncbi:MAG: PAS domain S-box protein [Thermodesulfovibrionales bacterium]